jgi:hypothetical protein
MTATTSTSWPLFDLPTERNSSAPAAKPEAKDDSPIAIKLNTAESAGYLFYLRIY